MIYRCTECFRTTFETQCPNCDANQTPPPSTLSVRLVPLYPEFYPEFQYQSKGFIKDFFGKKKEEAYLNELLGRVLTKYNQLKNPYFINFIHTTRISLDTMPSAHFTGARLYGSYSEYEIFHEVLVRKGFDELSNYPSLLGKLLFTTVFSAIVQSFSEELSRHIKFSLDETLRSWIEESGTTFRDDLPLFFFHLWRNDIKYPGITYNDNARDTLGEPLLSLTTLREWQFKCEKIYFDLLVGRLQTKLEYFDPRSFITMYRVDNMDGFTFEEFLAELFQVIGYDVQLTKKTGDQGADLFATAFGKTIVIQAKNYMGNVGNSAVQQVISAKTFYKCDEAMVVTNSYFTSSAKELANSTAVKLIDRNELQRYLDDYNQAMIERFSTSDAPETDTSLTK